MAGNTVKVEITAEDKTDRAFASVAAQEAALSRLSDQTTRKEIAAHGAVVQAEDAHARATKLLADVEKMESDVADRSAQSHHRLAGVFSSLAAALGGGDSGGGKGLGAVGALDSAGNAMTTAATGGSGLAGVLAALAPIIAAATVALFPFITGLVVATAGIAGFAALAIPEISKVIAARQALSAAETKYDLAKTAAQRASALQAEKAATAGLTEQQKALMGPLGQLGHLFSGLQKAIQPEVMRAFGEGIKIIKDMLPALRPLLVAAGHALDGFLKNIDTWLKSSSGQKFIKWFEVEGPMAMRTFGRDLWIVTRDVSDVFHFLYDTGLTFDRRWRLFWHNCTLVVDGFRSGFAQMGHLIESIWNQTIGYVIDTRGAVLLSWFQALPQRIVSFFNSLPGQMLSIGQNILLGLLHGLESMGGSVIGYVENLGSSIVGALASKLGIGSPSKITRQHGLWLVQGLAEGMDAGTGLLAAAAGRMARTALPGGYGHGGAGGGQIVIEFHAGGNGLSQEFFTDFANGIRVRGGSPQLVTKKVVFQ